MICFHTRYLKIYLLSNNINPIYKPWLPKVAQVLQYIIIFRGWAYEYSDQSVSWEAGYNGIRAHKKLCAPRATLYRCQKRLREHDLGSRKKTVADQNGCVRSDGGPALLRQYGSCVNNTNIGEKTNFACCWEERTTVLISKSFIRVIPMIGIFLP